MVRYGERTIPQLCGTGYTGGCPILPTLPAWWPVAGMPLYGAWSRSTGRRAHRAGTFLAGDAVAGSEKPLDSCCTTSEGCRSLRATSDQGDGVDSGDGTDAAGGFRPALRPEAASVGSPLGRLEPSRDWQTDPGERVCGERIP
jgi:hypothetical protein